MFECKFTWINTDISTNVLFDLERQFFFVKLADWSYLKIVIFLSYYSKKKDIRVLSQFAPSREKNDVYEKLTEIYEETRKFPCRNFHNFWTAWKKSL